jgi:MFS superfamily sulfate permease-like transporter
MSLTAPASVNQGVAILASLIVYGLFGTSRQLAVGPEPSTLNSKLLQ